MKWLRLCAVAGLAGCALGGGSGVQTLGEVTEKSMPSSGNWLLAATPSILRYDASRRVEADLQEAIAHYEAVAAAAADDVARNEALRRAAYLRLQQADEALQPDDEQLHRAVAHYQALLRDDPQDPNRDQVLYQLARVRQMLGEREAAVAYLREIQQDFAGSPLQGDVAFRLGELGFARKEYARAADDYRRVLASADAERFHDMARYKLGWAEFRLSEFEAAVAVFVDILERELPPQPGLDPAQVLESAEPGRRPWISDALRVISLSLAAEGGSAAWPRHFETASQEPAFAPLLYTALGELLLEKRHYTGAAAAFASFAQRHPDDDLAPAFSRRQIESLNDGGFGTEGMRATMAFVQRYAPDAPFWSERQIEAEFQNQWLADLDRVAAYHHHNAQQDEAQGKPSARQDYLKAARWYQRRLDTVPEDAASAPTQLLLAESLQAAGLTDQAIQHFDSAAYAYPGFAEAGDAAYAALLLRFEAGAVQAERMPEALAAADRLLLAFPTHAQWQPVALRTMDELADLQQWPEAVAVAERVMARPDTAPSARHHALAISADAHFARTEYPAAEQAYAQLLQVPGVENAALLQSQLALSVYRQAERARDGGDLASAARHFLRVGERVPGATIRNAADFDAAAALISLGELAAAQPVLEGLLARAPEHELAFPARRKLAVLLEQSDQPVRAAAQFEAVATHAQADLQLAREALWHAAGLYREAGQDVAAGRVYTRYAQTYPQPLARALEARAVLADLAGARDPVSRRRWLKELFELERAGGSERTTRSRLLAAQAALELGRQALQRAAGLPVQAPLEHTVATRQKLLEQGLNWLSQAVESGFVETVPEATYATAQGYADLAGALIHARLPRGLSALEQEEFTLLLEEQAFPFEELAIQWHESNLAQLQQDVWDRWVAASAQALAALVPAQYAKTELLAEYHEDLD